MVVRLYLGVPLFLFLLSGCILLALILTPIISKIWIWKITRDIDRRYKEGWYD